MRTFLHVLKPVVANENFPTPNVATPNASAQVAKPPFTGYQTETPASLECIYGFVTKSPGCEPNVATATLSGGSKVIAIVDAYDDCNIKADLTTFSTQFALPAPTATNFQVINRGTTACNAKGTGWDLEETLDVEYAHAMAPLAKIVLIEAASNSDSDLFAAVHQAAGVVAAAGGGQVSMSFGGDEYSGEASLDANMLGTNVVFYASSGDSVSTSYPCMSTNVVCVGGTSNRRWKQYNYAFLSSFVWTDEGAGTSPYIPLPAFQSALPNTGKRMAPDVSAIADPNNGVWVYNSTYGTSAGWFIVGGTSLASPVTAALDNLAGNFQKSSLQYLTLLYATKEGVARDDIVRFYCGAYYNIVANTGWDNCAGWGTPKPYVLH